MGRAYSVPSNATLVYLPTVIGQVKDKKQFIVCILTFSDWMS